MDLDPRILAWGWRQLSTPEQLELLLHAALAPTLGWAYARRRWPDVTLALALVVASALLRPLVLWILWDEPALTFVLDQHGPAEELAFVAHTGAAAVLVAGWRRRAWLLVFIALTLVTASVGVRLAMLWIVSAYHAPRALIGG